MDNTQDATDSSYRIGAVERLTGIPAVTIRMWERRYGAVEPERSAGNGRLYSRVQVARLTMLKRLVDAGHAISTVAALSDGELSRRIGDLPDFRPALDGPLAACVIGSGLQGRWPESPQDGEAFLLADYPDIATALAAPGESVDALVVDLLLIGPRSIGELTRLRAHFSATVVIAIYHFAPSEQLAALHRAGFHTVSAPLRVAELQQMLPALLGATPQAESGEDSLVEWLGEPPPARRFTAAELAETVALARTVQCECPEHLSQLITKLAAFEAYSQDCESRTPADAVVHTVLHQASAQARRLMEDALQYLITHELADAAAAERANNG